ncbi:unnamed protein product [Amoebophrya sp. A120]|nr:unnamed protein product [Amoebophrya sp. A120]|eukprot:GSA120T00006034001.1
MDQALRSRLPHGTGAFQFSRFVHPLRSLCFVACVTPQFGVLAVGANARWTVEAGGVDYQHDGHTRTRVPREVWHRLEDAPRFYFRFPLALGKQGIRLSDDKTKVFFPLDEPSLHIHFLRYLNGGLGGARTNAREAGYGYGFFIPSSGLPSDMLATNVGGMTFEETVTESSGGSAVSEKWNTQKAANSTWRDPVLRQQSTDPRVREKQILAASRVTFNSNLLNRYHTIHNPALMDRLMEYTEGEAQFDPQNVAASSMGEKVHRFSESITSMRRELDETDLAATPLQVQSHYIYCMHFARHKDISFHDVERRHIAGGSVTRKGGWVSLRQLLVVRRADLSGAPLPFMDHFTGTVHFTYDEERDTLEALCVWHAAAHFDSTPPVYTDDPPLPLGQRKEVPPVAYYREFPVPGYLESAVVRDTRVRDNNMWQSAVAKYWYQKMWTYPVDYTYLWPEDPRAGALRCPDNYLEVEVLDEIEKWNFTELLTRTKRPDANIITSEEPTEKSYSQARQAIFRILRKSLNCMTFGAGNPEDRFGYGISHLWIGMVVHALDEITYLPRHLVRRMFSATFFQRAKWIPKPRPFQPAQIADLAGIQGLAASLKSQRPEHSYRFTLEQTGQASLSAAQPDRAEKLVVPLGHLDFDLLESPPLQIGKRDREVQNCLFLNDDAIMNLRIAAETNLFPFTKDVYADPVVKQSIGAPEVLWNNARTLSDSRQPTSSSEVATRSGAVVFTPAEQAVLLASDDMLIQGVASVNDLRASVTDSTIWRKDLVYHDWRFRRTPNGRPDVKMFEREAQTSFYPCSVIRKKHTEFVSSSWSSIGIEDGIGQHISQLVANSSSTRTAAEASICDVVQQHCASALQQFASVAACRAHYGALPLEDSACKTARGDGASTYKKVLSGNSFSCKWTQSHFVKIAPETYCPSLGPSSPEGDRCSPSICSTSSLQEQQQQLVVAPNVTVTAVLSSCEPDTKSDIIASTLDSLPFCLPSLVGSSSCSANCTQALNTFLAKHVQSGAMKQCEGDPLGISETDGTGSHLLHLLQVNARTLIHRCLHSGGPERRAAQSTPYTPQPQLLFAVDSGSSEGERGRDASTSDNSWGYRGCVDPRLYLSERGCRSLDWAILAREIMNEWSGSGFKMQRPQRITATEQIAWRDEKLFDLFLQPYFGFRTMAETKAQLMRRNAYASSASNELWVFGNPERGAIRYTGFEKSYETLIARSPTRARHPALEFGWSERFPLFSHFLSGFHPTYSRSYNATRELQKRHIRPFADVDPKAVSRRSSLYGSDLWDDLRFEAGKAAITTTISEPTMTKSDEENLRDLSKIVTGIAVPGHWHRSHGYLLGTGLFSKLAAAMETFKRTRKVELFDSVLAIVDDLKADLPKALPISHFSPSWNAEITTIREQAFLYETLHSFFSGSFVLARLARGLIEQLRENWCELGQHWLEVPYGTHPEHFRGSKKARILLEHIRIHTSDFQNTKIEADPRNPAQTRVVRYSSKSHHLRDDLFPNPDEFDFNRDNLGKISFWGMLEENTGVLPSLEVTGGAATAVSQPVDVQLMPPRVQRDSDRFRRAQRKCLGRNTAIRWLFKNVDKYLPASPFSAGPYQCSPGNPNFVHHGVALLRQLIRVESTSANKTNAFLIETFVHGKAVQDNLPTGRPWTKFNTNGEDTDGSLFLFLNGFPHAPQSWARVLKHLHERRPGSTSALLNVPGWGKGASRLFDAPASDCSFLGKSSDILRDLIVDIKLRSGSASSWDRIFLIGDSTPVGSGLAWAAAHKLNVFDEKHLVGLISLTPHPELMLRPAMNTADPRQFPFYSLLSPIIGESAIGMKDFAALKSQMEDDFDDGTFDDGTMMRAEYVKFWRNTGARSLTCYFRDNFEVKDGRMHAVGDWFADLHPKHPHILLLNAEREISYRKEQWLGSFTMIPRELSRHLRMHTVSDASSKDLLFSDKHSEELAEEISAFAWSVRMTEYPWLLGVAKIVVVPPVLTGGLAYDTEKNIALGFALFAAAFSVFAGLYLERNLGSILIRTTNKEVYWRFGQVAMVPICLACMASASWLGLPLWFAALYKFGFPEVTTLLLAPWLLRGKEHWVDVYARFFDGVGHFIHHTGASIIYTAILAKMVSPLLLTAAIPLSLQHAVSPLKYQSTRIHGALLTLLEVWYQFEFFHILPQLRHWVPVMGLCMLTFAHWWWLARQLVWLPLAWFFSVPGDRQRTPKVRASVFMTSMRVFRFAVRHAASTIRKRSQVRFSGVSDGMFSTAGRFEEDQIFEPDNDGSPALMLEEAAPRDQGLDRLHGRLSAGNMKNQEGERSGSAGAGTGTPVPSSGVIQLSNPDSASGLASAGVKDVDTVSLISRESDIKERLQFLEHDAGTSSDSHEVAGGSSSAKAAHLVVAVSRHSVAAASAATGQQHASTIVQAQRRISNTTSPLPAMDHRGVLNNTSAGSATAPRSLRTPTGTTGTSTGVTSPNKTSTRTQPAGGQNNLFPLMAPSATTSSSSPRYNSQLTGGKRRENASSPVQRPILSD